MTRPIQLYILAFLIIFCDKVMLKKSKEMGAHMWHDEVDDINDKKRMSHGLGGHDELLDKIAETIASGEVYLKKMDTIEFRVNRLDKELHEKADQIMSEIKQMAKDFRVNLRTSEIQSGLENINRDLQALKKCDKKKLKVDPADFDKASTSITLRLQGIEENLKSLTEEIEKVSSNSGQSVFKSHDSLDVEKASETHELMAEIRRIVNEQRTKKCECKTRRFGETRTARYPNDCSEIQMQGYNVSGIYKIMPENYEEFYVLCDLSTAGGGWTVIQNRFDGSQSFYKSWFEYKYGFGNLAGEFWLGLEKIHHITTQKLYELRVDMETDEGKDTYAEYSVFSIGSEDEGYRISTLGNYFGNAGDSLSYHAGQKFSTYDVDNDEWKDGACAVEHGGAWWYRECDKSNLNGHYMMEGVSKIKSTYWLTHKGIASQLAKTRMLIRSLPASRPIKSYNINKNLQYMGGHRKHGVRKFQHYRYDDLDNNPNLFQ